LKSLPAGVEKGGLRLGLARLGDATAGEEHHGSTKADGGAGIGCRAEVSSSAGCLKVFFSAKIQGLATDARHSSVDTQTAPGASWEVSTCIIIGRLLAGNVLRASFCLCPVFMRRCPPGMPSSCTPHRGGHLTSSRQHGQERTHGGRRACRNQPLDSMRFAISFTA